MPFRCVLPFHKGDEGLVKSERIRVGVVVDDIQLRVVPLPTEADRVPSFQPD